jgi:excisionase family DNA binding protein
MDLEALAALVADHLAVRLAPPSRLMTAAGASEQLGVPASWLMAEARAGRVPHVKLGKYVRFDAAELDAWWRQRAAGPWRTGSRPVSHRREAA